MENYVIITKQDGMVKYYSDSPCCMFNRFAKYKCRIAEVTFAPVEGGA